MFVSMIRVISFENRVFGENERVLGSKIGTSNNIIIMCIYIYIYLVLLPLCMCIYVYMYMCIYIYKRKNSKILIRWELSPERN